MQTVSQRFSFQKLHDQEVHSILLTDVEKGADVEMIQGRDRFGLAVEALPGLRIGGEGGGQDLYGDGRVQAGIARAVHLAHAARA